MALKSYSKYTLLLILLTVCFSSAQAQSWEDTVAMIDKIFSRYQDGNPGAQLAISKQGKIIYSAARGMANLEYKIPNAKNTKIEAGSVSKQFTSASILLLEQQGKLSLTDDIRKYVPEMPDYGHKITIKHLMNHVSGIKDWGSIAGLGGWPRGTRAYSNEDALQIIIRQKNLNNKPGDEYIYSNSGYNLLAIIVQRVSGSSLAEFSKKFIFEPAGMLQTEWRDDYQRVVSNRAFAYSKIGTIFITNMPNENAYGNGGLLTTVEDLLRWNDYYLNGKFGNPSLLPKQLATTPFNNGRPHNYAAGLVVDSLNGWASITHSGATAGYRANLDYFPQLGLSIAWLSNNAQQDLGDIPFAIRNLLVKNKKRTEPAINAIAGIDIAVFKKYIGSYREPKTGAGLKISEKDDGLYMNQDTKLSIHNASEARLGRSRYLFLDQKIALINGTDSTFYFAASLPDISNFHLISGQYFSNETASGLKIYQKEGKLFMKGDREELPQLLNPQYKNGFSFFGGDLFFEEIKNTSSYKLYISIARARKVGFEKIK